MAIASKAALQRLNGNAPSNAVTRTADNIIYRPGEPGYVLIDFETKGMPPGVREKLDKVGDAGGALVSVLPTFKTTAMVVRFSTSAGLYRKDTGDAIPGSDGRHAYVAVKDVGDSERFPPNSAAISRPASTRQHGKGVAIGWRVSRSASATTSRYVADGWMCSGRRP